MMQLFTVLLLNFGILNSLGQEFQPSQIIEPPTGMMISDLEVSPKIM